MVPAATAIPVAAVAAGMLGGMGLANAMAVALLHLGSAVPPCTVEAVVPACPMAAKGAWVPNRVVG